MTELGYCALILLINLRRQFGAEVRQEEIKTKTLRSGNFFFLRLVLFLADSHDNIVVE